MIINHHFSLQGIRDYQTEADRRAQQFIISSLSHQFSKATIIGEEDEHGNDNSGDGSFNEYDETVLSKECPKDLLDIKEDDVRFTSSSYE